MASFSSNVILTGTITSCLENNDAMITASCAGSPADCSLALSKAITGMTCNQKYFICSNQVSCEFASNQTSRFSIIFENGKLAQSSLLRFNGTEVTNSTFTSTSNTTGGATTRNNSRRSSASLPVMLLSILLLFSMIPGANAVCNMACIQSKLTQHAPQVEAATLKWLGETVCEKFIFGTGGTLAELGSEAGMAIEAIESAEKFLVADCAAAVTILGIETLVLDFAVAWAARLGCGFVVGKIMESIDGVGIIKDLCGEAISGAFSPDNTHSSNPAFNPLSPPPGSGPLECATCTTQAPDVPKGCACPLNFADSYTQQCSAQLTYTNTGDSNTPATIPIGCLNGNCCAGVLIDNNCFLPCDGSSYGIALLNEEWICKPTTESCDTPVSTSSFIETTQFSAPNCPSGQAITATFVASEIENQASCTEASLVLPGCQANSVGSTFMACGTSLNDIESQFHGQEAFVIQFFSDTVCTNLVEATFVVANVCYATVPGIYIKWFANSNNVADAVLYTDAACTTISTQSLLGPGTQAVGVGECSGNPPKVGGPCVAIPPSCDTVQNTGLPVLVGSVQVIQI